MSAVGQPNKIPQSIIEKFKPFGKRFVKVSKPIAGDTNSGKSPFELKWQEHPYAIDSPELVKWVESGGNYGLMAGFGIIIIDLDERDKAFEEKINTLTIQSGRISNDGRHIVFRSDVTENGLIFDANGKQIGNLQADRKIVVGASSRHNSGNFYKVINDVEIQWISKKQLDEIFGDRIKWASKIQQEIDEEALAEAKEGDIPIAKVIDLRGFKQSGDEFQGPHLIHGSTGGHNLSVNVKKNSWKCFRCDSGGGWLMWIAVKHGFIQCNEAHPGALRGELFIETLKAAKEDGFDVKEFNEKIDKNIERFFEGKKLKISRVGDEIMRENAFVTKSTRGLMYRFNAENGIYEPDGEDFVNTQVALKLGEHYSIARRLEIDAYIRSHTIREVPESDKYLHAVKNGVLDVRTSELKQFNPEHVIFNALPVTYNATAKAPLFQKFLIEVVPPENDRIVLQEFAGYCLLKDSRFQKALLLTGRKQNGKSTFLNVTSAMLGKKNISSIPLQNLGDRFAPAQLYNRLANVCADLPDSKLTETGTFKKIAAGDSLNAENKYSQPFEFEPYVKLLFSANKLPDIPKDVEAFLVRWLLVEFPNQFLQNDPRRDPDLKAKLTTEEELSGILNWALEGLQRLLQNKRFTVSETLEDLEESWEILADTVKAFADRCITNEPMRGETVDKVHAAYRAFCERHKVTPVERKRFSKELNDIIGDNVQESQETARIRIWRNIVLKAEAEN
jgi:putative DNA primase/helicase